MAFELVKGMSCDTVLMTRLTAAQRDRINKRRLINTVSLLNLSFFRTNKQSKQRSPALSLMQLRQYDCVSVHVCTRLRTLWSSNALHYSFGWQSRGPHPATPHTLTLRAPTAARLHSRPEHQSESAAGPSAHRTGLLGERFPSTPSTPTDF